MNYIYFFDNDMLHDYVCVWQCLQFRFNHLINNLNNSHLIINDLILRSLLLNNSRGC